MSEKKIENICVFCGSSEGNNPEFVENARQLGVALAKVRLVCLCSGYPHPS